MRQLFGAAERFVAIYASNYGNNTGSVEGPHHVRHRKFTDWVETHATDWTQTSYLESRHPFDPKDPRNTSFADFHFFARR